MREIDLVGIVVLAYEKWTIGSIERFILVRAKDRNLNCRC